MPTLSILGCAGRRPACPVCILSLVLLVPMPALALAADEAPRPPAEARTESHSQIFATVNGRAIPTQEYENAFASLVRQKFYHGKLPDRELVAARDEVKSRLVQRIVLLGEANRRGLRPDATQIDATLADYERRYAGSASWRENRERLVPGLRQQLEEQSLVAQLEAQVRQLPEPSADAVRAYFAARTDLFTEPEKLRLSVVLLTVDPSSPATTWDATREEAQAIYRRLQAGAEFGEAARLHSGAYADSGGDMGYLHRGMLPEILQEQIDRFELGRINPPIDTLQGVAIFRLEDRIAPQPRDFDAVAQRARELLIRERQDQAWRTLVEQLVAVAEVRFFHGVSTEQREGGKQ